jgi:steroid 5-alpha reductase family enzyme
MKKTDRNSIIAVVAVSIIGLLVALAGSQDGRKLGGIPLFAAAVAIIFIIQWVAFIFAYVWQTEKFFDLTGGLTYITVISGAALLARDLDTRSVLLWALVVIWAGRLATFLFRRIHKSGKDDRFDEIKPDFFRFLSTWTIQGLWVTLTMSAALIAITSNTRKELDWFTWIGLVIWIVGFTLESVADAQKSKFKADPSNSGKFIHTGLWSRSRHPNYFGEIVLWIGVLVIALPVLHGWQWVALISPLFVTLLLTRVSGVPMLEKKADKTWGGQPDYEEYKSKTPVLFPRL